MPRFQVRDAVVEAFQLGEKGRPTPAPAWFGSPDRSDIWPDGIQVMTHHGRVLARWGWWIVRHPNGLMSVWAPEEFAKAYEPVSDA